VAGENVLKRDDLAGNGDRLTGLGLANGKNVGKVDIAVGKMVK